jgi:fatty-acyl-CoA synthase
MSVETLHDQLDRAAERSPKTRAFFPSIGESLTVPELRASSRAMAAELLTRGVQPGDRVGLLAPNAPEFLQALFALQRVGAVPCPLPLPAGLRGVEVYLAQLGRIVEITGMRDVVISDRLSSVARALASHVPTVRLLSAAELLTASTRSALPTVGPQSSALVQFTSGSTAAPKGVQLTHSNVIAGLDAIANGIQLTPADIGGFWLPLFHDMGLFGTLTGLLNGVSMVIWSPTAFVKNPARWLTEFTASGATVTASPNFGYDYLISAFTAEDAARLDLSAWRIAFNGAEAISVDVVERFAERFGPSGFRPETMFCVYGLAEATLAVTFPPLGRPPAFDWVDRHLLTGEGRVRLLQRGDLRARAVASVGSPVAGMSVRVVEPATGRALPSGQVGEVQLRGPSVTEGYLQDPGLEPSVRFTTDGWLRTGDLGYLRAGELYWTGRSKEMIVVRGSNYYPEDVEAAVRDLPQVYKRRVVAFADCGDNGAESIALVAETELTGAGDRGQLMAEICHQLNTTLGLTELAIHLVEPRSIPRTTSGKFRRVATREMVRQNSA